MFKIMVVEDDGDFIEKIKQGLSGNEIIVYTSSKEFKSELKNDKKSLISKINNMNYFLLDFMLEGSKGIFSTKIFETIFKNKNIHLK